MSKTPFMELLDKPDQLAYVLATFEKTVIGSFAMIDSITQGKMPAVSEHEIKRRSQLCEKWFRIMRVDLGFSLQRTLDILPRALASELLQTPFDPSKGSERGWAPSSYDFEHAIKV